ncbi:gamma-glutamylcyclotransferase [Aerophototrophica crusticola]|uniref:Putative gamma-glutamylcyclotransferase n=1 Tax=Aerophototrophica crusticola TaxID=1709002 RepID=A0A858R7K1_9PROT|nr:gamma-glutamylcyclotransferase [Rhodospirillaceae bacterium B3]
MLLFAYGTLLDPDVRSIVLGRPSPDGEGRPALLRGYRRVAVVGEAFPALAEDPAGTVAGRLFPLRNDFERQRVQFFEGYAQTLVESVVECSVAGPVPAFACLGSAGLVLGGEGWDFASWVEAHKPTYLSATAAWMAAWETGLVERALDNWAAHGRGLAQSAAL